eukprot:SM000234S07893  [mRNA]  locus=s234:148791:150678:+ [translate_table: standard]
MVLAMAATAAARGKVMLARRSRRRGAVTTEAHGGHGRGLPQLRQSAQPGPCHVRQRPRPVCPQNGASARSSSAASADEATEASVAAAAGFVLEAADVARLRSASDLSEEELLTSLVVPVRALALAPISRFHVGAVALGASGRVFAGVNLEFPGLPLHHSVHAEQFLVANAAQHGERQLRLLAVSAAPCGHCRQFLQELRKAGELPILIADGGAAEVSTLEDLLPHRFGPHDLLEDDFPLLLEPQSHSLELSLAGPALGGNGGAAMPAARERLLEAALTAARSAYAPYSGCPSGLALVTTDGAMFSGAYMESAAYNPSLSPLQAALVALVSQGRTHYSDIIEAVLVEKCGATVAQAGSVQLALAKIAPGAMLTVYQTNDSASGT